MAEQTFQIEVVGVDYVCDKCNAGTMHPHGQIAYMTDPIKIPHKCNNCGAIKNFSERYPTVRHLRK